MKIGCNRDKFTGTAMKNIKSLGLILGFSLGTLIFCIFVPQNYKNSIILLAGFILGVICKRFAERCNED